MTLSRRSVEVGLLVALCFFLPLFEAPKNILWVAYLVVWTVNRVRARDFGGRWDRWDTLIAAWIASGYVVAAFAGLDGDQWRGAADLFRYGTVLWVVKRSRFTAREIHWVLGALIVSTVVGLIMGYATWTDRANGLKLNSVGHVNHTAIYLAIMLGLCASWLFTRWQITAIAVTAFVLVSLFVTASRGAVVAGMMMLPLLAAGWWRRSRIPAGVTIATLALATAVALVGDAEVIRKQQVRVQADNVLAYRGGIWRMALAGWARYPWAGVGMDNYALITHERVKTWRSEAGKDYVSDNYVQMPHAHSLYLNTLAERGVIGAAALAAVLVAWLVSLLRHRPAANAADHDWLLWGSATSAWIVTTFAGAANTTLHHEHGILAVLLLGLWLSRLRESAGMDKR